LVAVAFESLSANCIQNRIENDALCDQTMRREKKGAKNKNKIKVKPKDPTHS
jgi:hypothetical protein